MTIGNNMSVKVSGTTLTITVDLSQKGTLSKKGTTRIVAGTNFYEKITGKNVPAGLSMSMVVLRSVKAKEEAEDAEDAPVAKKATNKKPVAKKPAAKVPAKKANKPKAEKDATDLIGEEDEDMPAAPVKTTRKRAA